MRKSRMPSVTTRSGRAGAANRPADQPVGAVNPVVEAVAQAVDAGLPVAGIEPGEDDFANVGLAVAVGVLGINDVGGGTDQHALLPRRDAVGKVDLVEKDGRLVVLAVAVGVFEQTDAAARLIIPLEAGGVVEHFGDPQFAVRTEVDGDGEATSGSAATSSTRSPLGTWIA